MSAGVKADQWEQRGARSVVCLAAWSAAEWVVSMADPSAWRGAGAKAVPKEFSLAGSKGVQLVA